MKELKLLVKDLSDFKAIMDISLKDESIEREMRDKLSKLAQVISKSEFKIFLNQKYDKKNAILSVSSGAGGSDAEDWTAVLLRMYQRYSQRKGFKTNLLQENFGQAGPEGRTGIKQATIEIKGKYAYGILKKESGVHRLVRISPFSAKQLRHTSFALVEILPEFSKIDEEGIKIKPEDLKFESFRASGPGGQNVNRRETAVRVTYLPFNLSISSQNQRSQFQNRESALKILYAKLYKLLEARKEKEIKHLKGKYVSPEWGHQIRSYVLYPYKLVKDKRTKIETSSINAVLNGDLDKFIEVEIKTNDIIF